MRELISELFWLNAALVLAKDDIETKKILNDLLDRWNSNNLDLMDLEPRIRKVFFYYHKYQTILC